MKKLKYTKEELEYEYNVNKLSFDKISKKLHCSPTTLVKYFKLYGITIHDRRHDLTGYTWGEFTVIKEIGNELNSTKKRIHYTWLCRCSCGKEKILKSYRITSGCPNSCGCKRKRKCYYDMSVAYFNGLERGAKERNISFNITIEEIYNQFLKQDKKCYFTGIPIKFSDLTVSTKSEQSQIQTASVDRLDSSKGYTKDNIVIVHKNINIIKGNVPYLDFINICHLISKNFPDHDIYALNDSYIMNKNNKRNEDLCLE
jgi:AraC-like DNA-binding protein